MTPNVQNSQLSALPLKLGHSRRLLFCLLKQSCKNRIEHNRLPIRQRRVIHRRAKLAERVASQQKRSRTIEIKEFERLIQIGSGRVIVHLQTHDDAPYKDAIRKAITHNLAYDRQCEHVRGQYHYDIIMLTQSPQEYIKWLKYCLREPDEEMSLNQMFDLAPLLVKEDESIREAMYFVFKTNASHGDYSGMDAIIELDDLAGFEFVANQLAKMDIEEDYWILNDAIEEFEKRIGEPEFREWMRKLELPTNPRFHEQLTQVESKKAALKIQQEEAKKNRFEYGNSSKLYSLDELKQLIDDGEHDRLRSYLRRWSYRCEDEAEIKRAADTVLKETDPGKLKWLLRLFSEKPFPGDTARIIEWAENPDEDVSFQAMDILEKVVTPQVREVALRLAKTRRHPRSVVAILNASFQPGDEKIAEELNSFPFENFEMHGLGFSSREMCEAHPEADILNILLLQYEKNPCSLCRERTLDALVKAGKKIPEQILQEAVWDSNFEVRELIQAEMASLETSPSTSLLHDAD